MALYYGNTLVKGVNVKVVKADGVDTSDANVTASDVVSGKVAYSSSGRVVGTMNSVTHENPTLDVNMGTGRISSSHTQDTGAVTGGTRTVSDSIVTRVHEDYSSSFFMSDTVGNAECCIYAIKYYKGSGTPSAAIGNDGDIYIEINS